MQPYLQTSGRVPSSVNSVKHIDEMRDTLVALLPQVHAARVRARALGLKSSELKLRRALISLSRELGIETELSEDELNFAE